ncbi:hypothetical protein BCR33DRAFT_754270 [Rhizoclosmatium globosum]|uniref:SNF2 family DNA-dependent ATPase domain-containing protein n=1 Tax=Rhizoclosmatium globosum TaxID=329046 RepID=A0A1Y2C081_9FUNG|nr:hypothetical protein BCR33DRAFT_754270 [Rhizoclosmatium globosum]|eukprot:ORY40453.1 hypothetical protein BCR33DRAFT_754270 [Rhizoclosmatium globosum]
MSTRLDRLVLLLDTGSTSIVRQTAAQQIGEVQRAYPSELYGLLARVLVHLRSKSWETRTAAALAIGAIAVEVGAWEPVSSLSSSSSTTTTTTTEPQPQQPPQSDANHLSFASFDIATTVARAKPLVASGGSEFDLDNVADAKDGKDRIEKQKKLVKLRLGIELQVVDVDLVNDNDFTNSASTPQSNQPQGALPKALTDIGSSSSAADEKSMEGLSARERNALKRKQKLEAKKSSGAKDKVTASDLGPAAKKVKTEQPSSSDGTTVTIEHKTKEDQAIALGILPSSDEWPFEGLCEQLCIDLFHHRWEIRHGAALDVSIRILCVLALDRFADFVGDHVVVPVRETCARVLGVLMQLSDRNICFQVLENGLLKLIRGPEFTAAAALPPNDNGGWEMRHAALIGLKYWMAVKRDLVKDVLVPYSGSGLSDTGAFLAILNGLKDHDDDVRSVSSSTLLPIADLLPTLLPPSKVYSQIVTTLWDTLQDLDDLTAATSSIMDLLSSLLTKPEIRAEMHARDATTLSVYVPRLYPFFRHAIVSVRSAVLKTVRSLLDIGGDGAWISNELLRLLFQNFVLEEREAVLTASLEVWTRVVEFLGRVGRGQQVSGCLEGWFSLLMTPVGVPLDLGLFFNYATVVVGKGTGKKKAGGGNSGAASGADAGGLNVAIQDRAMVQQDLHVVNEEDVLRAVPLLKGAWDSMMAGLVAADSGAQIMFNELVPHLGRVRMECQALINAFAEVKATGCPALPPLPFSDPSASDPTNPFGLTFTPKVAERFLAEVVPQLFAVVQQNLQPGRGDPTAYLLDRQSRISHALETYAHETIRQETMTTASASCAIVHLATLPPKLNPIVRSLMGSIKTESSELIQSRSAKGVAGLLDLSSRGGKTGGVLDKVVKNLGVHLCNEAEWGNCFSVPGEVGILMMTISEKEEAVEVKSREGKKGKELNNEALAAVESAAGVIADLGVLNKVKSEVARRGARFAFQETCSLFGATVFDRLPKLWEICSQGILEFGVEAAVTTDLDPAALKCKSDPVFAQTVVDSLVTLATVVQAVDSSLHDRLCTLLRPVCRILRTPLMVVRHAAGLCIAAFAKTCTPQTFKSMVENVVPLLGDSTSVIRRQGAIEAISLVISNLEESRLLPYIVFLIVPVLGRMSDPDESVRFVSTNVFAHLVKLVPLESGVSDPEGMDPELVKLKKEERKFMGQLVGSEKVESFEVPKGIEAELRPYQKDGVSWLAFLNRYGLHGILCDDMGLGKTLQSICMLASDHHIRATKFAETGSPEFAHTPSLVVCPSTLAGHWKQEILQYAGKVLKPLVYVGGPSERKRLRGLIPKFDVIITSYEILRNDVDDFAAYNFNYCILDEGHVIKSAKTKLTKAVKTVKCMNRLILSGTPVQNNVLELWSLFDFLMPGFLGTESQFQAKFGKPILASRDAKSSSREQERGALALEALHKQVLPFLMRRMKEDVLDDLPPKIIQDFYVELNEIQKQLYEDFGKSEGSGVVSKTGETHVFQALQYLQRLCNHPSMVLKPNHPKFEKIMDDLKREGKQILQDCGLNENAPITAAHRVLVFCQRKEMLDFIENGLFKNQMKSVTYLRMDGSTDSSKRHDMVQKFNADPSIDVFLLTTAVGGLGLNLTGADTVIFVEHDWNPMKDLQAMDRAHRIGQKRVVNVYRLITRGTLEEKIMGLQKFKLNIASSIINQDNAGIESMETSQILDLFSLGGDNKSNESVDPNRQLTQKEAVAAMGALWDEKQYESFDDMGDFLKGLGQNE